MELVHESMDNSFLTDEVLRCINVGLLCVQEQPEDRPLMSSVILMLGGDIMLLPKPKQPGFVARISTEIGQYSGRECPCTDMSIMAEGR